MSILFSHAHTHKYVSCIADDNVGVEVAAKETTDEIDAAAEEIDSTVLDTTSLATSKLKRSAANTARSRINGSVQASMLTDDRLVDSR